MATLLATSEPLKEELSLPNYQLIANQFSEILKLLKGSKGGNLSPDGMDKIHHHFEESQIFRPSSTTFSDKNKNYASEICAWLDSFIAFVENKSRRMEVLAFFESFETTSELTREEIKRFIKLLNGLEDSDEEEQEIVESIEPKKFRKVEMLRAIFAAFGLLHTDIIAGAEKVPSNPLVNLYFTHTESNGSYPGRFYIDNDSVVYFESDKDSPSHIFTNLREEIARERVPLTLIITTTVPDAVEAIVSEEGACITIGTPHSDDEEREPSDAVTGRLRRREKDRGIRAEMEATRALQKNQEWYTTELEMLGTLSAFLHERFEELRNHLIGNVPYVGEVLDYLSLTTDLEERGYEVDSTEFTEIKEEQKRRIKLLEQLIEQCKTDISMLETEIEQLGVELSQSHDETGVTQISKKITKKQGKIAKNRGKISLYTAEVKKEKRGIGTLINRARSHRLNEVPNSEQFAQAFHYSLRAEELYSAPEYYVETLVSRKWIHDNIVPLFVSIIGTHLDEYHGVNTRDLYELMGKIDDLPGQYSEEVTLPDTEDVSEIKVNDFFTMLIPLIPQDYLETLPKLPIVVTPEGVYHAEPQKTKEPRVRKTHREIREVNGIKKTLTEMKKGLLKDELKKIEEELEQYEIYWREKLKQNVKTRMSYVSDIEKIKHNLKVRRAHPNKTKDDLEALIILSHAEEEDNRKKISGGTLKSDEATYQSLITDRTNICKRLQSLK